MNKKRVYIFIFFLAIIGRGYGQQDPQFSLYMYSILPINPGIAGTAGICATLNYRQQWAGFYDSTEFGKKKTSPRDIMFTLHAPVDKKRKHGLGLTVLNDAEGYQTDITVKLAYSYKINIGGGVLGIGPSVDMLSRKMDNSKWVTSGSSDPVIVGNIGESDMYFGFSFGAYYFMQTKWYAGVSATQIVAFGGDKVRQKAVPHLYAFGGYSYVIPSNPNWTLKPSALVKTDLKTIPQVDLTMAAEWNEFFWFGVTYRAIDAVSILAGAKPFANFGSAIRGLEVAVAYDITTSQLNGYRRGKAYNSRSFGSPEVMVKYCFNIVRPPQIYGYKGTRLLGNKPIEYR